MRAVLAARGIRVARDLDVALHAHPADCHGVSLEFFNGYFHDNDEVLDTPMKPAEYWRDEHPLGVTGLRGLHGRRDRHGSGAGGLPSGPPAARWLYEAARPAVAGTAVGLQIADAVLELVTPVGDGPLRQHLLEHGEGIRSTVFGVRDLDVARRYFEDRGVEMVSGTAPDTLAIPGRAEPRRDLRVLRVLRRAAQSNSAK